MSKQDTTTSAKDDVRHTSETPAKSTGTPATNTEADRAQHDDTVMSREELDNWRMGPDDHRWDDPEGNDPTGGAVKGERFEVHGGRYFLEGQEVDFTVPDKKDDKKDDDGYSIQQSIRIYQPSEGIYWWHPEHGTFSAAGPRSGSGDLGTSVGRLHRRTNFPEENSPARMKESDAHLSNIDNAKEMRERTSAPQTR